MTTDPVCEMQIEEKHAAGTTEYKGRTFYFCSPSCKAAFDKEPEKYTHDVHAGSEHHHH